ncbi:Myb-related protein 3R-1 [Striga hermonthica]|uniref:Myb-related protein 3R-1 n=1 Tax=Striga hermonthica TaxID=68872 RepID=A0A9N7MN03_STRHE|nr:Myb-related protein 3R-1 [Striga hermonthica]
MESDRIRDTLPDSVRRIRASHGRTTGPARRSTKGQWTPEEDEILRMAVQRFKAKNWKKIAELIKDRTDVQCLHRWQKVLNPELVKGPWSKEEDEIIIELVNKYGPKKWSTIAQHLPGRIGKQCRERWHNHLNPGINKEAWTQDEELALIRAHQIYGNKWAELTKFLPGRSDNAIKNHWNSSVKKKLDMYLASGLLSQFQGPPLVGLSNHSLASPSSEAQKIREDNTPQTEADEVSEGSQSSYVPNLSQEAAYVTPEEPCGPSENFLEHNFSLDWSELDTDELPGLSLIDVGQESSGQLMSSSSGMNDRELIPSAYIELGGYTSVDNTVCADGSNLIADNDKHPSGDVIRDFNGQEDPLLNHGLSCWTPLPIQDQYNSPPHVNGDYESILPTTPDGSIAKLIPVNNFVLAPLTESHNDGKNRVDLGNREDSGALSYEPPRFPSSEIPFLSCELVQSGGDMHQEFSPFGIRQLTNMFKLWDSPSRNEDNSPVAILKSAAKSFSGTPSILKKRQRDLLSPLSEKRGEKKLEGISKDSISELRNDICRLEVMFNECADGKGVLPLSPDVGGNVKASCAEKDDIHPAYEVSESIISRKECSVVECSEKIKIWAGEAEIETKTIDQNATNVAKDSSGILIEHDTNDLLFFSPDRFGLKGDGSSGVSARAILSPPLRSCFSVVCSPRLCTEDNSNNCLVTTSLHSQSPSDNKVKSSGGGRNLENNRIYMETPLKRSIESPSAWRSPWFMNAFVPGPRVDTDITIEDFGYYLSPGDRSYDALGLMKQVGEQSAGALANAHKILGHETPETLLEGKYTIMNKEAEKENIQSPNSHNGHLCSTSNIMTERRTLDFSECETPVKESGNTSDNINISSPSLYLLKACR